MILPPLDDDRVEDVCGAPLLLLPLLLLLQQPFLQLSLPFLQYKGGQLTYKTAEDGVGCLNFAFKKVSLRSET